MNEEFAVLLFFFGISLTVNVGLAISWFRSSRRTRRLEDRILAPPAADNRRIDRIEQAVDGLATQVDQLANAQEFLNRVVGKRVLPEPAQEDTPH
jgi:hypothetical protein